MSLMQVWGLTDTGLVRKENQDAYAADQVDGLHKGGNGDMAGLLAAAPCARSCWRRSRWPVPSAI